MREIKVVQDSLDHNQSEALLRYKELLLKEFDVVLQQEETIWFMGIVIPKFSTHLQLFGGEETGSRC